MPVHVSILKRACIQWLLIAINHITNRVSLSVWRFFLILFLDQTRGSLMLPAGLATRFNTPPYLGPVNTKQCIGDQCKMNKEFEHYIELVES